MPTGCLCRLPSTSYTSSRAGRWSGLRALLPLLPLLHLLLLKLDRARLLGQPCKRVRGGRLCWVPSTSSRGRASRRGGALAVLLKRRWGVARSWWRQLALRLLWLLLFDGD